MGDDNMNPRDELKEAMAAFAPDLRLLDCGWVLTGDADSEPAADAPDPEADDITVDWVGVDPSGRLNVLLWLGPDDEDLSVGLVELALETLHRVEHQLPFILSHLGNCGIRPEKAPRLVLAATHFSASVLRQLAVLGEERMRLVEVHEVRTDSGVSHHLVLRWPEHEDCVAMGPVSFLECLPEGLQVLADSILQRLDHVDERVQYGGMGSEYLEWCLRDHTLCTLELIEGCLHGAVSGSNGQELPDEEATEAFVGLVLQRYFEILEEEPVGSDSEEASIVDQGLSVVLSHEELDAFM